MTHGEKINENYTRVNAHRDLPKTGGQTCAYASWPAD
jgi:hypothetical protein